MTPAIDTRRDTRCYFDRGNVHDETCETAKPKKPYPEFPLFPHLTKRWAKKIRGKMHYFGPWDNPDAAVAKYLAERDRLQAGLPPVGVTPADTR